MKNPIINSPYLEPTRHFKSDERGISDEIVELRRPSSFYIPVPRTRKRDRQLDMNLADGAYSEEMQQENEFINKLRLKNKRMARFWIFWHYQDFTRFVVLLAGRKPRE